MKCSTLHYIFDTEDENKNYDKLLKALNYYLMDLFVKANESIKDIKEYELKTEHWIEIYKELKHVK